jgi:protein subunit release factor B
LAGEDIVRGHRSDYETGDAEKVLGGELDEFIQAYLKNQSG